MLDFFDIDSQRTFQNLGVFVFYDLLGKPINTGKNLLEFFEWDLVVKAKLVESEIILSGDNKTISLLSVETLKNPTNKKSLKSIIKKLGPKNCVVFYTNKKRRQKFKNWVFLQEGV